VCDKQVGLYDNQLSAKCAALGPAVKHVNEVGRKPIRLGSQCKDRKKNKTIWQPMYAKKKN